LGESAHGPARGVPGVRDAHGLGLSVGAHNLSSTFSLTPEMSSFSATPTCPLFATHFVRDGLSNYAVIQADENVAYAKYVVSERLSTSSTGTTSFSGRVDQPTRLYQWNTTASVAPAAPDAAALDSASAVAPPRAAAEKADGALAAAAPAPTPSGACFTFPLTKGCIYFIQIEFELNSGGPSGFSGAKSNIHWFVDPNKRRIVTNSSKKRLALAAGAESSIAATSASAPSTAASSTAISAAAPAAEFPVKDLSAKRAKKTSGASSSAAGGGTRGKAASAVVSENPALEVC
jgi:hypothetical protein